MKSRKIGRSGLSTPRLVLGGNVFGWTSLGNEAFRVLDRFVEAGGTMIDTADVYSAFVPGHIGGESEELLGEWLRRRGRRDDVLIATKVGMLPRGAPPNLSPKRIAQALEASLARLGTHYVDLYYAHRADQETPIAETLYGFDQLVRSGKVRALGASNFDAIQLQSALDAAAQNDLTAFTVLQPEYNLIRRRRYEGSLRRLCVAHDIGVLPYFGLASGFLTGKYRSADQIGDTDRAAIVKDMCTPENLALLRVMDEIGEELGASLPQIALAWLAAKPGVVAPIASARNLRQLEILLPAMTLELSVEHIARLDEAGGDSTAP